MDRDAARSGPGWLAVGVIGAVEFVLAADGLIIAVALPAIDAELGFGTSQLSWVVSAFVLAYGGLLLAAGRAADLFGRRRVVLIGLACVAIGSVAAGLAPSPSVLIAARALQGFGTALFVAAGLGLVARIFPQGRRRDFALGVYSMLGSAGFAGGALLGGLLTTLLGWRLLLLAMAPLVMLGGVLVWRLIRQPDERVEGTGGLNIPSAILVTTGLGAVIYALVQVPEVAAPTSLVPAALLGASLLLAFAWRERTSEHPLVPPRILAVPGLVTANLAAAAIPAGLAAVLYIGSLYLQQVAGYSAWETGLAFLPTTAALVVVSLLAPGWVARLGATRAAVSGLALQAAGLLLLVPSVPDPLYVRDLLPGFLLVGIGAPTAYLALIQPAVARAGDDSSAASGIFTSSQQVGNGVAVALLTTVAVMTSGTAGALGTAIGSGAGNAFLAAAVICGAGAVVAVIGRDRAYHRDSVVA